MGMVKHKMMEVQEEATEAFDRLEAVNPYVGTMWERCWQEAWDYHADNYGDYIDQLAQAEDFHRNPDLCIWHFQLDDIKAAPPTSLAEAHQLAVDRKINPSGK